MLLVLMGLRRDIIFSKGSQTPAEKRACNYRRPQLMQICRCMLLRKNKPFQHKESPQRLLDYGETPPIFKSRRKRGCWLPGLYRMLLLFLELRRHICIMLFGSCMPSSPKESISPCFQVALVDFYDPMKLLWTNSALLRFHFICCCIQL